MGTMGERIEAERKTRGWSQQRLADEVKKLGGTLSQSAVDKLEKRSSRKSAQALYIARALEVNHDWLISGKGPRTGLPSLDKKMQLLPQDDFDDLYDDFVKVIEGRLEKRNVRQ